MTENKDKDKFPKIKPPSDADIQRAKLEHAMENPDIRELLKQGKNIHIDDESNVTILEDKNEK